MLRLLGSRATIVLQHAPTKVKPYASGQFPIQSVNSADWRSYFGSSPRRLGDNDEKSPELEELKKFLQSQAASETELNVPKQLKNLREAFERYKVKGDPEYNRYLKEFFEAEALLQKGSLATPEELVSTTPKDLLKKLRREIPTDLIFDKNMSGDNEVLGQEMLDFIRSRADSEFREVEKAALDETQELAEDDQLFAKTVQEILPPPREVVPESDERLQEGKPLYKHESTRPRYAAKQSRDLKERFNKTSRDINKPAPSLKEVLDTVEPSVARALYGEQVEAQAVPGMNEKLYGFNLKDEKFKFYTDKPTPPSGQPTSAEKKLPNPASFGREDEDRLIQQNVGQPAIEKLELHTKLAGFVSTHEHRKQLQQDHVDMITTLRKDKIAQGQIREPNFRVQDSTNRTHEVNPTSALAKNWNAPKYIPAQKAAHSLAGNQSDQSVFYNRTDEPVSADEVASRLTPQPFALHRPALDAQDMFVALPLTEWDQDLMRGKTNQLKNPNLSAEENERLGKELLQGKQNVEGNYSIYQERTTGEGTKFPEYLSASGFGFSNPYFPDLGTMPDAEAENRRGKTGAEDLARSARRVVEVFDKRTVQSLKYFRDYPTEAKKWVRVMLQPAGIWNDDGEWEPWGRFHEFFNKEAVDNLFLQQPESSAVHRYARDHKLGQFAQFDDLKSVTSSDETKPEEIESEEEYRKQLTVKVSGIEESFRTTKLPVLKEMTAPDRLVRLPRDLVGKYRFGLKQEHVQHLSPHAQRLLSFQYAKAQEAVTRRIHDSVAEFGKHQLDTGHPAVQVATMSERIRGMEEHLKKFRKDNTTKVSKAKLESRRKKMLRYLKNYDIHKYFEVINKYHIVDDIRI